MQNSSATPSHRYSMEALLLGLLVVCTALNRYRFDIFSLGFRIEHFGVLIATVIGIGLYFRKRQPVFLDWTDALLLLFLFSTFISSFFNATDFKDSLKFLILMSGNAFLYFLARALAINQGTIMLSLICLSVVGLLQALFGIISWLFFPDFDWGLQLFKVSGMPAYDNLLCTYSPSGTLFEPNIFGSYEVAAALIAASFVASTSRSSLHLLSFTFSLFAVGLNLTRGAWLGFLIGLLLFLILANKKKRVCVIALSGIMLIFSGAYLASDQVIPCRYSPGSFQLIAQEDARSFISKLVSNDRSIISTSSPTKKSQSEKPPVTARVRDIGTLVGRMSVYKDAIADWKQHPFLGNGANSFGQKHETHRKTRGWIPNIVLMTLHDSGVIGFLLLFGWLFLILRKAFIALWQSQSPSEEALRLSLLLAFCGLFFAYQFTSAFWLGFTWLYLGLIRSSAFRIQNTGAVKLGAD